MTLHCVVLFCFFFFKQKTAYEMRISDWSSDVCSSDLAVVPEMRKRGGGKIVNQVSGGAFPAQSIYGISKLALVGLTTTLARQVGREKINVSAIAPGNTTSDAGKQLTPDDSPFIKFLEASVAMRERGAPDELVGTLLLLCSPAGDWITGQDRKSTRLNSSH